jgi:Asp-tRNA(Asn)/Glu-tRNA(Gln) amidotransferase A subunit family amidase
MGSVIRPAAYCGVVAFKPSFGAINRAGIKPQAESIDTVGIFGRTMGDVTPVAAVLTGARPEAFSAMLQRPPRVALYRGPDWSKVERPAEDALDAAAARLAEMGATIREVGDIELLRKALDAHLKIVVYELARALAYEWDRHRDAISPVLAGLIEAGNACSFDEYIAAQAIAHAARDWIAGTFTETDLWLTVSAPGEAPLGDNTGDPVLNRVWSLLHLPVITLPAGRGPAGVPLGIQLIGAFRRDAALLAAARWVEAQLQRSAHVESPSRP